MKEWNMKQKVEGEEGSGEGSNCKKEAGRRREMKEASTKKDKQEWKEEGSRKTNGDEGRARIINRRKKQEGRTKNEEWRERCWSS